MTSPLSNSGHIAHNFDSPPLDSENESSTAIVIPVEPLSTANIAKKSLSFPKRNWFRRLMHFFKAHLRKNKSLELLKSLKLEDNEAAKRSLSKLTREEFDLLNLLIKTKSDFFKNAVKKILVSKNHKQTERLSMALERACAYHACLTLKYPGDFSANLNTICTGVLADIWNPSTGDLYYDYLNNNWRETPSEAFQAKICSLQKFMEKCAHHTENSTISDEQLSQIFKNLLTDLPSFDSEIQPLLGPQSEKGLEALNSLMSQILHDPNISINTFVSLLKNFKTFLKELNETKKNGLFFCGEHIFKEGCPLNAPDASSVQNRNAIQSSIIYITRELEPYIDESGCDFLKELASPVCMNTSQFFHDTIAQKTDSHVAVEQGIASNWAPGLKGLSLSSLDYSQLADSDNVDCDALYLEYVVSNFESEDFQFIRRKIPLEGNKNASEVKKQIEVLYQKTVLSEEAFQTQYATWIQENSDLNDSFQEFILNCEADLYKALSHLYDPNLRATSRQPISLDQAVSFIQEGFFGLKQNTQNKDFLFQECNQLIMNAYYTTKSNSIPIFRDIRATIETQGETITVSIPKTQCGLSTVEFKKEYSKKDFFNFYEELSQDMNRFYEEIVSLLEDKSFRDQLKTLATISHTTGKEILLKTQEALQSSSPQEFQLPISQDTLLKTTVTAKHIERSEKNPPLIQLSYEAEIKGKKIKKVFYHPIDNELTPEEALTKNIFNSITFARNLLIFKNILQINSDL